jgi:transcriptional regulator with XRE-family HTH domain
MPKPKKSPLLSSEKSVKILLDKDNLRQYVVFLQNELPGLIINEISMLAGFSRQRLQFLLNKGGAKTIFEKEIVALFDLYEELKSGKKTYEPSKAKWKPGKRDFKQLDTQVDCENLKQYVDFLLGTFPGLTIDKIEMLANMTKGRIARILRSPNNRANPEEIQSFFRVYEILKKNPIAYFHNRASLCQYISFLQNTFPGLSLKAIAKMADIPLTRLYLLLRQNKPMLLRADEVDRLFKVYFDLGSGKESCTVTRHTRYRAINRVPLDKTNLRQYVDFLQETFSPLPLNKISELAGFGTQHLSQLLFSKKCKSISSAEVNALFQVYWDLERKRRSKSVSISSISVSFLLKKFPDLSISAIADLTGVNPSVLSQLIRNPERKMRRKTAEKLLRAYEDLKSGKVTYALRKKKPKKKTVLVDRSNLWQYLNFLKDKFPGLSYEKISELAGFSRGRVRAILNGKQKRIRRTTAKAIMKVYEDLESGKSIIKPHF